MMYKRVALSLLLVVVLIAGSTLTGMAQQEDEETHNTFGPQDVFGLFMGALVENDLILLNDGSVISGEILNSEFNLDSGDSSQTYERSEIFAMGLTTDDENNTITRLYVVGQNFVEGTLTTDLEHELVIADGTTLALSDINAIILSFDFRQAGRDQNRRRGFGQIFPIFTRMMGSMSEFDTVVTTEGSLASVVLNERDSLVVHLDSPTFGSFNFPVEEVAWVEFAQTESDRDVLVLQNGDRVSGTVGVEGTFSGTLASGSAEFSFSGDALRDEFRQIVFQIPLSIFGGGGGRGPVIRPNDN